MKLEVFITSLILFNECAELFNSTHPLNPRLLSWVYNSGFFYPANIFLALCDCRKASNKAKT